MEFIKVIHIVKLWLDAMPKSVVAHSISMTSRRKTTIQGVSTGRAWIWCDAATIGAAAAALHHGPDIPKFVQKLLSALYWILTESLFKKGLEYSNYTWKYSSKTLDLQFFISPFLNRIQRPGPLCTVHSWTLCAYGRCLLAPRRVFIGPVLFWQRMVVCHQNSLSLPHS